MRITRTHAAAFIGAIALALAAPSVSAQTPSPRQARPSVVPEAPQRPEIQVEPQRDVERDFERTYRYYRPIVRVGQDYTLLKDEEVREIRTVFGDVTIEGHVTRDIVAVLGNVRLASTAVVDGALVLVAGTATIEEGARVHGDMVVAAGTLNAPSSFTPGGDHIVVGTPGLGPAFHGIVPWFTRGLLWGRLIVPGLGWIWVVVGVTFLVGLLLNTMFDRTVGSCADAMARRPFSSFLLGLLVAILTVPAIVILAATVIGLAIVPFVICAVIAASVIGKVGVARALGRGVIRPETPEARTVGLVAFVIGFAILVFIYMVPVLGVLTWALTGVIGLGAAASTFRAGLRREQPPRPAPPVEPAVEPAAAASPMGAPMASVAEAPTAYVAEPMAAQAFVPPAAERPTAPPMPPPIVPAGDLSLYARATFLDRLAAFALDCLLVGIATGILDLPGRNDDGWFPFLLLAYHIAFWAWKGTTLGGIICALRVVRTTGADLRPIDAVVRGLSAIFSLAALGIGCLWMLQDAERQMWHDKIAGTIVVKVPRHLAIP